MATALAAGAHDSRDVRLRPSWGWSATTHAARAAGRRQEIPPHPQQLPGMETRLPLPFSEGVNKGSQLFVALSSASAAKVYSLHPRKGTIAVGADAPRLR